MQHSGRGIKPAAYIEISPEEFARGKQTVRMRFPKLVVFTPRIHREKVTFPAGEHDVPVEFADHWYLKANGAEPVPAAAARKR